MNKRISISRSKNDEAKMDKSHTKSKTEEE